MPDESMVLKVFSGQECLAVRDVVFGDVWLCAGQSNMPYRLGRREDDKDPASLESFHQKQIDRSLNSIVLSFPTA